MATVMATVLATLSVLAMYAEVLLVIYVAAEHGISESSRRLTFALVLALLLVALVLTNIVSAFLALTSAEWSSWGGRGGVAIFVVLHVLQVGVVWRAAKVHLAYERKAWLQLSALRLLHAGVLSLPFLLVQGRDTLSRAPVQPLHVVSLVVSVLSASLALVSFTVRKQVQDIESSKDATAVLVSKAPWRKVLGVVLLLFGTSLALASRAGSFVLLSLAKNWWVLLPIGLHFVIVAASAVASKACEHQCTRNVVLKEICVSYINIYEMIDASDFKRVRCKYVTFYTLVVVENIVMTAVWLLTSPQDYVTKLVVVVSLLAAFVFALVAKFASCGLIADPSEEPDLVLSDISDVLSVLEHAQQKSKQRLSSSVATVSTHLADRGRGDTSSSAIFENQTTDTFLSLDASSGSALSQQRLQGRSSRGGKDREGKREGKKEELGGELVEEEEGEEEERSHTDYSTFRSDATMEMFSIDDPTTCSNLIRSKRATKSKPKPHVQIDEGGKTQRSAAARRRRGKGEGATLSSRKSKKLAKIDPIALKEKYFKVYNRSKQKELESAVGRRATDSGSSKKGHSDRGRSCDSLTRTLEEVGRISRMPLGRDFDGDTSLTEDLTSSTHPQDGVETFVEPLPSEDGFPLRSVSQRAVKKAQCREEVLDFRSGLATCRMNQGRRDKRVPREKRLKTSNVDIELRALRTQPLNGHPPYLKHPVSGAGGSGDKVRPYSMCIGEKFDLDPPIIGYVCESPRVRSGAGEKNDKCLCNHGNNNNNPWSSLGPKMRRSKERVKDAAAGISSTFRRVSNELRKSQSSTNSHSVSTVVCRRPKPKPRAKASSQSKDQRASFPRWVKPRDRPPNSAAARMRNSHPVGFDWDASVSSDTTADVTHVTATGSCSGSSTGEDDFSSELSSFMTWSWSHKGVILRPEALAPRQICGASEERIKRWLETVSPALACPLEDDRGGSGDDVIKSADDLHGPSVGSDVNSLSVLSSLPSSARSKDSVMAEVGIPKGKHSAGRFVGGVGARPKYERSDRPLFLVATTSPRMGGTTELKSIHLDVEGKRSRTGNGRKQDSTRFIISDSKQGKRSDMVCDIQLPVDTMESLV